MANMQNTLDYLSEANNTPKINIFDFNTIQNSTQPINQNIQPITNNQPVKQNVIQDFLNQTKGKDEFTKKRKAVIDMLQNQEDDSFIEDAIINKMKFTPIIENQDFSFGDVLDKTKQSFIGGFNRIGEAGVGLAEGKYNFGEAAVRGGAGALQSVFSPLTGVIGEGIETGIQNIPENIKQSIIETATPTIEGIKKWYTDQSPEQQRRLANAGIGLELLASFAGLKGIQVGSKPVIATGKQVIKTGKNIIKGSKNSIINKVDNIGISLEGKGGKLRESLSGLSPNEISALKNTPKEEFNAILKQAKNAKLKPESDYAFTPYHEGAKKANNAFVKLEDNIRTNQKIRVEQVKNSPIKSINTTSIRDKIVKDIEDTFNIIGAKKTKGGIKYTTVKGRESLLDSSNIKDYEALKLLESVTKSKTPLQMMDTVKKMQNLIYDTNLLNKVSKDMKNLVTRSIGKLNSTFKEQMGIKYQNILKDMSGDIKLTQDLEKIFKAGVGEIGNRGELAMKRLASGTTTSGDVRGLALKIKERLGIDLIKEARLRQLAMDIVGDDRGGTLFKTIKEGKGGLIGKGIESIIEKTPLSKEATALARTGKKIISKKPKNADTTNNSRIILRAGNKNNSGKTHTKSTMDNSMNNDKNVKVITKKVIKKPTYKNKAGTINPQAILDDLTKAGKITLKNIDSVAKNIVSKLGIAKEHTKVALKIVKDYLRKEGVVMKDKIGEMLDKIADKTNTRLKFIDDRGTGISGKVVVRNAKTQLFKENKPVTIYRGVNKTGKNFYKGDKPLDYTYYTLDKNKANYYKGDNGKLISKTINKDGNENIFRGDLYAKYGDSNVESSIIQSKLKKDGFTGLLTKGDEIILFKPKPTKSTVLVEEAKNPIVNKKTGETLNESIKKLRKYGWEEKALQSYKNKVLGIKEKVEKITEYKLKTNKIYHGTSLNNANSILKGGFKYGNEIPESLRGGGYGASQNSISFSFNPKKAEAFTGKGGKVLGINLDKNTKIAKVPNIEYAEELNNLIPKLKKQGYDGVYIGGGEAEIVIFNKTKIKEIYKQARK